MRCFYSLDDSQLPLSLTLGRPLSVESFLLSDPNFASPQLRESAKSRAERQAAELHRQRREAEAQLERAREQQKNGLAKKLKDMMDTLFKSGNDLNAQDKKGATALHIAMQMNFKHIPKAFVADIIVKPLIRLGARTDIIDSEGHRLLDIVPTYDFFLQSRTHKMEKRDFEILYEPWTVDEA